MHFLKIPFSGQVCSPSSRAGSRELGLARVAALPMRDSLVQKAAEFLNNPSIAHKSLQEKKSFLESKGLTAEEINQAVRPFNGSSYPLRKV